MRSGRSPRRRRADKRGRKNGYVLGRRQMVGFLYQYDVTPTACATVEKPLNRPKLTSCPGATYGATGDPWFPRRLLHFAWIRAISKEKRGPPFGDSPLSGASTACPLQELASIPIVERRSLHIGRFTTRQVRS